MRKILDLSSPEGIHFLTIWFLKKKKSNPHLDNLKHLHTGDFPISIQIIHVEGPIEFLLEAAPGSDGQGTDKLPEVDGAVAVFVERPKRMLGELGGITIWEKLWRDRQKNELCITFLC